MNIEHIQGWLKAYFKDMNNEHRLGWLKAYFKDMNNELCTRMVESGVTAADGKRGVGQGQASTTVLRPVRF